MKSNQTVRSFYHDCGIKERYGISHLECQKACKAPFLFFKEKIVTGELFIFRVTYLGKFTVYPGTMKYYPKKLLERVKNGTFLKENYDKLMENIKRLNKND